MLCGPGITTAAGCIDVVSGLLEIDVPLVLDADALNCLSKLSLGGLDKTPELYSVRLRLSSRPIIASYPVW